MDPVKIQVLEELVEAIVAVGYTEHVRYLLEQFRTGEIEFEELVAEVRA